MATKSSSDKLKIIAYKKNTFSEGDKVGEYTVRYNPTNIQHSYDINFDEEQAVGSSGTENKYQFSRPERLTFEIIFDATVMAEGSTEKYEVDTDIKDFKKLVVDFNGDIHRPNYIRLAWGAFSFKGQIAEISFAYSSFSPQGKAMKAKADVTFVEVVDVGTRLAAENKSSPDLTHIITVKEGDSLPMLCHNIYNDPLYYLQVARINNLENFRKLKAGETIMFPPLDK
ncbi:MAG TPA: hypothetical protein DCQ31_04135 [Bacteroidales bacterium]|nr:hypothetical protein [Bacteroidales bacterium]